MTTNRNKKEQRRRRELDRQRWKCWVLVPTRKRFETIKAAIRVHGQGGMFHALPSVQGHLGDLRIGMGLQEAGFRVSHVKWLRSVQQVGQLHRGFKLVVAEWGSPEVPQWIFEEVSGEGILSSPKQLDALLEACKKKGAALVNL